VFNFKEIEVKLIFVGGITCIGNLEKAGKSVALLLHFVTDLQMFFQLLLNNINKLSRI
jgi:hypothetical protein